MTIEMFDVLDEHQKVKLIFDANMISESNDDEIRYQLFQIENFYVETKTSLQNSFKRVISTYTLKNLPAEYLSEILSIPVVLADSEKQSEGLVNFSVRKIAI